MELISWNIQWGRGCDGRVDLTRIVATAREIADFDVLCLQEVARGYPELPGGPGRDQVAELAGLLPDYRLLYAPGVDRFDAAGEPRQFGNLIATRLPVRAVFRQALPWPADPTVASMPRVALEATLLRPASAAPIRVICTHLEYYSAVQRLAQARALRDWHAQACGHARRPPPAASGWGPFAAQRRPSAAILCGDFNAKPEDEAMQTLLAPYDDGASDWIDAWLHTHPGQRHAPTCGLHDRQQWKEPPFACDFMLVSADLRADVAACEVDDRTQASDHQPVHLTLREPERA